MLMKGLLYILTSISFLFINVHLSGQVTNIVITKTDLEKIGTSIPASDIGEPVGSVKLYTPRWVDATSTAPAYGVVEGSIMPVDLKGWPINFRVVLPAAWSLRGMQQGGGGMNGVITADANAGLLNK